LVRHEPGIHRSLVSIAPTPLPEDPATLQNLLLEAQAEITRLQMLIAGLLRYRFGRRSEQLSDEVLDQGIEDLEQSLAEQTAKIEAAQPVARATPPKRNRGALPADLPRVEVVVDVADKTCPCCGAPLHAIGEDRAEMLDHVPAQFRVQVIRRPRYGCRVCEQAVVQAPAPERPIDGGMATEALLAHVLVSKYADHLPLYRQAQIFAREGVTLDRSTLCNWVGRACWWLEPLHALILSTVLSSPKVVADDTTMPVLDPGRGRTKAGRLWCYATDNRPWSGPGHPAAAYVYSEDRKGEHPATHLKGFQGLLQVDGYAGFNQVQAATNQSPQLAFCWARLPKVPCAKRMEWQTRGMRGGNSMTSTSPRGRRLRTRRCNGSVRFMRSRAISAAGPQKTASETASSAATHSSRPSRVGYASNSVDCPAAQSWRRRSAIPSTIGMD
jgi:transposase